MVRNPSTRRAAATVALCLATFLPLPARAQYLLHVQVTDSGTGLPIEGAVVMLHENTAGARLVDPVRTGSDGRYAIEFAYGVRVEPGAPPADRPVLHLPYPAPDSDATEALVRPYTAPPGSSVPEVVVTDAIGRRVPPGRPLAAGRYWVRLRFDSGAETVARPVVVAGTFAGVMRPTAVSAAGKGQPAALSVRLTVRKAGYAEATRALDLETSVATVADAALAWVSATGIVPGDTVIVVSSPLPSGGGAIRIDDPGSPGYGIVLDAPASAYPDARTVTIDVAPIEDFALPEGLSFLSPLVSIAAGPGYSDSLLTVTIPANVPPGHFAMGFQVDPATGYLEALPLFALTDSSVTIATRHLDWASANPAAGKRTGIGGKLQTVVLGIAESALLALPEVDSGFRPGVDDWEFTNYGSVIAPGGHCAGQTISALWYYLSVKPGTSASLFGLLDTRPGFSPDNRRGYRFASVIQQDHSRDNPAKTFLRARLTVSDSDVQWKAFLLAMHVTGTPQLVQVWRYDAADAAWYGHEVVAYRVVPPQGRLYVADPNNPGQTDRFIPYVPGTLGPYGTKQNAAEPDAKAYTNIGFDAVTAMIDFAKIGTRWAETLAGTIGSVQPNTFPASSLKRVRHTSAGEVIEDLPDRLVTTESPLTVFADCPGCTHPIPGTRIPVESYSEDGRYVTETTPPWLVDIPLAPGDTTIGFGLMSWYDQNDYFETRWLGFRWIQVSYQPAARITAPVDWFSGPFGLPIEAPGTPGMAYRMTMETDNPLPDDTRYRWNFGDGNSEWVTGSPDITYTWQTVGHLQVSVTAYDPQNRELASASVAVRLHFFASDFETWDVSDRGLSGTWDDPILDPIAETFDALVADPASGSFWVDYDETDGTISAYLDVDDGSTLLIATSDQSFPPVTDRNSYVDWPNADTGPSFMGRAVTASCTSQQLACEWFEVVAFQTLNEVVFDVTAVGRKYEENDQGVSLVSEGSRRMTVRARETY